MNKEQKEIDHQIKLNAQAGRWERANLRCDPLIREALAGTGFSYGYIGNVETWGDDRSWRITRDHPGRIGTSHDQIGPSYLTDMRRHLLETARAIRAGFEAGRS